MSKGLEALKTVKKLASAYAGDKYAETLTEDIEKELKALEIIKNKRVDVFELLLAISNSVYRNPLERYNSYIEGSFNTELTPQEFDLLKEVLEE